MEDTKRILTPKERQQRNHQEMTELILNAARAVMREQGVSALNLQEVARRVGMRAPSLYNYFPSKLALYEALFAMGMKMYRERMEADISQYGASWEGIQRMMEGYLSFALENPELYQLLFERPVPGFVPSADGLEESAKLIASGQRAASEAMIAGALQSPFSPEVTMNLVIALMHGVASQHLANEPELPLSSGRFGSLIPIIIELLRNAWGQDRKPEKTE
ncbi:MAG: TetR/AcrR family transcriptional regulator [Anaerolineae bacterium]|nr:TetR/AcrR family transcriptional regulator [Anaerolineae bacterium]